MTAICQRRLRGGCLLLGVLVTLGAVPGRAWARDPSAVGTSDAESSKPLRRVVAAPAASASASEKPVAIAPVVTTPASDKPAPTTAADIPAAAAASTTPLVASASAVARPLPRKPKYPIPPKIRRYAQRLLKQYDTNGDGVLQTDEWARMQGNPKLIDLDRDGLISEDDIARYVARYALTHRIHLSIPDPKESALAAAAAAALPGDLPPELMIPASDLPPEWSSDLAAAKAALPTTPSLTPGPVAKATVRPPRMLQKFVTPARELPPGTPDWFLARDLDGDGQLTLAEYAVNGTAAEVSEFQRFDVNGDGVITPTEAIRLAKSIVPAPPATPVPGAPPAAARLAPAAPAAAPAATPVPAAGRR